MQNDEENFHLIELTLLPTKIGNFYQTHILFFLMYYNWAIEQKVIHAISLHGSESLHDK